jgi:acetyl esterase/lipase
MGSWQSRLMHGMIQGFAVVMERMPLAWMRSAPPGSAAAAARRAGIGHRVTSAGGVRAEWFLPPGVTAGPVLLYFHGGGWTLGLSAVHCRFLAALSRRLNWRLLAVDYRLAPEHPFPAGLDDCLAAYRWLRAQGQPAAQICLGGDSAGGNFVLALLLALKAAGEARPAAGLCLSPAVDLTEPIPDGVRDPLLTRRFAERLIATYVTPAVDPANPLISPLHGDLAGLPPLLIQMGGIEFLRASAEAFAAKARAAGVDVTLEVAPEMWHAWQLFGPGLPEAETAVQSLIAFARRHAALPITAGD